MRLADLTHDISFQTLLLQAANEGRGRTLFGESQERARTYVPPFLVGRDFPDVYLEHPLIGDPFLDVTVLLGQLDPGMRIASPLAGDHGALLDCYARMRHEHPEISCGFELDTKEENPPVAAVHFQPRMHTKLVRPFFDVIGEPERADLYLDLARRMPSGWPLSFCGLFRGRPGSPLRVCGYLPTGEKVACAKDRSRLAATFDAIGFAAYDDAMLEQVSTLMAVTPGPVDFQFDVMPDASLGTTFAIDMQFAIQQPKVVRRAFESGPASRVMGLLEDWGAADSRWRVAIQSAFARALPVQLEDESWQPFAFTLMPQWAKARWTGTTLQGAKLYHLAHAGLIESPSQEE